MGMIQVQIGATAAMIMDIVRPSDMSQLLDFNAAAEAVLTYLHNRLGFSLWMVTRTEGNDWIVLQVKDGSYGIKSGTVLRWTDSFCSRMVSGEGPRIAPCSDLIEAYASAPIGQRVTIGAYIGVPLHHPDGSLFGTLCAIDPSPQDDAIVNELPLIELLAQLLSSILYADMKTAEKTRLAERLEAETLTDGLTGLFNRRGWDHLLTAEEKRCMTFGHPATIMVIDLDNLKQVNDQQGHAAGDELIRRTAHILRQSSRQQDAVARVGGDEFTILFVECSLAQGLWLRDRIQTALANADIEASVGVAGRHPGEGLKQAWLTADQSMYCHKAQHR
jgi:diguanylate cyclase